MLGINISPNFTLLSRTPELSELLIGPTSLDVGRFLAKVFWEYESCTMVAMVSKGIAH